MAVSQQHLDSIAGGGAGGGQPNGDVELAVAVEVTDR